MSNKRLYESLRYDFSQREIVELGDQLARETATVSELEKRKSAVAAELGAEIKKAHTNAQDLAQKIIQGFELRDVECLSVMDEPRPGWKQVIRIDTNQLVREEQMSREELQGSFGFREPTE